MIIVGFLVIPALAVLLLHADFGALLWVVAIVSALAITLMFVSGGSEKP